MINFEGTVKTVCPFYLLESKYKITCEGLYEDTKFALVFTSDKQKNIWQKSMCFSSSKYHRCPFAKMLESEKYT